MVGTKIAVVATRFAQTILQQGGLPYAASLTYGVMRAFPALPEQNICRTFGRDAVNTLAKSVIGFVILATASPAFASDGLLTDLQGCRSISDVAKKAACYDKLVDVATKEAEANSVPRDPVRDFGASDIPVTREVRESELAGITTTISAVSMNSNGRLIITTEAGSVWVQAESVALPRDPKVGQKIELRRGAIGSFMAQVEGGRNFRVKRVR